MEYAKNLIKAKAGKNSARRDSVTAGGADADVDDDDGEEESWTFVGADADTIDDLGAESVLKRNVLDFQTSPLGISNDAGLAALGSRGLSGVGGARGAGVS